MIRSLQQLVGPHALLTFLDSFRYPLAGELAMVRDLAWTNRIPGDWGLEIGVLAEVFRNCALRAFAKPILPMPMTTNTRNFRITIPMPASSRCASISRNRSSETLASEGVVLTDGVLKTLRATYLQAARERSAATKTTRPSTASRSTGTKNGQPSKSS